MSNRLRLAPLLLALAACGGGPPVWAPTPTLAREASDACARAKTLRERAPALLEEGRIDRAARVLQRSEDLCPFDAPLTWGGRVTALAMLGRSAEAMQLVARIERSDRATEADRAAAAAARTLAEQHGREVVSVASRRDDPELFDPAEKKREAAADLFRRGSRAARAGDHAAAKKLFLESWTTWHPSPRALIEAGLAARALGERADAQRLFDRAAYDDSASAIRPEVPTGGPRAIGGGVVAWSRAGARIAIGGDDEITVLDADMAPLLRIPLREAVTALDFADGDATLVAGFAGGKILRFDGVTGAARGELKGHRGAIRVVATSPDGSAVATAADDTAVRLWETTKNAPVRALPTPRPAVAVAWSATGAELAWADDSGAVTIAEAHTAALTKVGRVRGAVRALAFDGRALLVVTATERLRFDLDRPRVPARSLSRGRADGAVFSAGSAVAAIDAGDEIVTLDLATGARLSAIPSRDHGGISAFTLSPAGRSARRALIALHRDRTLSLVASDDPSTRRDLAPPLGLAGFAAAPTGKLFAGAAEDGRVLLWNVDAPRLATFWSPNVRALAFSPDSRSLAVGGEHRVELRNLAGGGKGLELDLTGRVECLSFSADGMRLAVGSDPPRVSIFAAGSAQPQHDLRLEGGPIRAARFSPDGRALLLAPKEGVVLWRPEGNKVSRFPSYGPEPRDVAFTPDGWSMIVADKRGSLAFGKPVETAPRPSSLLAVPAGALALAVAANGTIATAEGDRAVGLRGPTGLPISRFRAPESAVRAIAILPQGAIAASFADGAIRLFRAPATGAAAVLRPIPGLPQGALAGLVEAPSGHFELVGPDAPAARAALRCRIGPALYPLEVCADQFEMKDLLRVVLSGQDPAEADP